MKQTNLIRILRILCVVAAIAVTLIPAAIAMATGQGFSETASHTFISISVVLLMGYILLGIQKGNKRSLSTALATCVGLVYVLIMQWV